MAAGGVGPAECWIGLVGGLIGNRWMIVIGLVGSLEMRKSLGNRWVGLIVVIKGVGRCWVVGCIRGAVLVSRTPYLVIVLDR